jgi:plastocyanin
METSLKPGRSASRRIKRAIAPAAAAAFVAGAIGVHSHAAAGSPATTRVTVSATDFRFKLSVKAVHTGTVLFTVVNKGEVPHNFKLQRLNAVTRLLQSGDRGTLRVRFRKPGRYYYLCTVDNHVLFGMAGYLRVVR